MIDDRATRTSTIWVMAGLLLLLPLAAMAQPHHRRPFGHGHGGGPFGPDGEPGPGIGLMRELMAERLDLTDEQREQVRAVLESYQAEGESLREGLWETRRELQEAAQGPEVDEAAVLAAGARLGEQEAALALHRAKVAREVRNLLTPEQEAELDQMRMRHREFRERRLERRHGAD